MHPAHLLLVVLVLAGVVVGALALMWAWRTSRPDAPESVLAEFVRRDRHDPEAARRWLRDQLQADDAEGKRRADDAGAERRADGSKSSRA
jgi:uncharacterized membrane protein YccC